MPSLRLVGRNDPWWDLDGRGARRTRLRHRVVAALAFMLATVSCGLTLAAWAREVGPVIIAHLH